MLLTLLMNLSMIGPPPKRPGQIVVDLDSRVTTAIIIQSKVSEQETIDSPITTST